MNSRDRVLAALQHQETDRVPIDLGGHRSSGVSAIAYPRLRAYLGLEPRPVRVYDMQQQLAVLDDDVLERFGVDTIELGRGFALSDADWVDWVLPDGAPCQTPAWAVPERREGGWALRSRTGRITGEMPDGALYFESCYWPFVDGEFDHDSFEAALGECLWSIDSPPGPLIEGPGGDQRLVEGARRLRQSTDRAVIALFGSMLFAAFDLYRMDSFLALMVEEPKQAHDILDRFTEHHIRALERYLGQVGSYIDIINFADDFGMQNGPLISPKMFREFFKERYGRIWQRAKELADVKVMLHCCGSFRKVLPDLIDIGLDAINPVQISAAGMDAGELKREFGRDITFWGGGCDTQWVLAHGTPEAVRDHVSRQVEVMRPGGGFVFQQVHNVLADVPPENIVAMLDTVLGAR